MALNSSQKLPICRIPIYREDSLPTYEEATGKFQRDGSDEVTSRDQGVERAFQNVSILQYEAPAFVPRHTDDILQNCRRAKQKRDIIAKICVYSFLLLAVFFIILIIVSLPRNNT